VSNCFSWEKPPISDEWFWFAAVAEWNVVRRCENSSHFAIRGTEPFAGLVLAPNGVLFGVTGGGLTASNVGAVFGIVH
jgi:hypothetical protein